jgi:hypothetical protein
VIPVDLGPGALLTLVPISAVAGIAAVLAFLRWTDLDAFRRTSNQIIALVMELGLFIEEPRLVLRAQRELLRQNARLLLLLARPTIVIAVAFFLLLPHLEALYGNAALRAGDAAIVTAQLKGTISSARFALSAPHNIAVETPGVRVLDTNQISWRIRPLAPVSAALEIIAPDGSVSKRIAAGPGLHYVSPVRASSWITFLLHPVEPRITSNEVSSIAIAYPPASILHVHWMIWFIVISTVAATITYFFRNSRT